MTHVRRGGFQLDILNYFAKLGIDSEGAHDGQPLGCEANGGKVIQLNIDWSSRVQGDCLDSAENRLALHFD
jgi:hypothetical protein